MSQLVGTTGGFQSASDALEPADDILCLLPTHQLSNASRIACTSAIELNGVDDARSIINIQFYRFGASAPCFVNSLHAYFMLVYTFCTSSNSSRRSTIFSMVSRCSSVTSFRSLGT